MKNQDQLRIEASIERLSRNLKPSQYIRTLFDPVQTHAVYNVTLDEVDAVKNELKAVKATRFRIVKTQLIENNCIVCFKLK